MKFSEMPYERPDVEEMKKGFRAFTERLKNAASYEEAREVFLEYDKQYKKDDAPITLAYIRQSIDTRDEFYNAEKEFWDENLPEIEEYEQEWIEALVESPFRAEFAAEFGDLMFVKAEMEKKTFSPAIIEDLQKENELVSEYDDLIASAQIPFEGGIYTLSQLWPFESDPDDEKRLAANISDGKWYAENGQRLDEIYDELVRLRDGMGKKLGFGGYTKLGYYRMGRNCYTEEDVKSFREAVIKYVVPIAERLKRQQAERIGRPYPMYWADQGLKFRKGNPRPAGDADYILGQGKKFYDELSPETSEFFRTMLDEELMDVLSTEGKQSGGYENSIDYYERPFIFANFNGTQGDVEVVTHEAGHAFAYWMNRKRVPFTSCEPSAEACEVHSMSMEFFGWRNAEGFFGADADKFKYSHLASALTFIPYGTLVDHFQHIVYEKPEMTPAERHAEWKRLSAIYMPWERLSCDDPVPFYPEGRVWQSQEHIYQAPFYYIDYCLAQTVALEFWALLQKDEKEAWERYMDYTKQGGTRTFTELLKHAGLKTPFDEECLKEVCETADKWLDEFDLTGIE